MVNDVNAVCLRSASFDPLTQSVRPDGVPSQCCISTRISVSYHELVRRLAVRSPAGVSPAVADRRALDAVSRNTPCAPQLDDVDGVLGR